MTQERPIRLITIKSPENNLISGANYFFEGIRLLWRPELRLYILVPLAVNLLLFFALTAALLSYFNVLIDTMLEVVPTWLSFLAWMAWFLFAAVLLLVYGYTFNLITNIIAAPFYGLLAQKTEEILTGRKLADEPLARMVPRVIWRETTKILYFVVRGAFIFLLMLLLATFPVVNLIVPIIGLLWGAWTMVIQYVDYPADNNQLQFATLRRRLRGQLYSSLGFGGMVMGSSIIPFINIFAMPAAVTGGTLFWLRELKEQERPANQ